MTPEEAAAIQANSAQVQAFAAWVTVAFTAVLAAITFWYARSAKNQVQEAIAARKAAVSPYLYVHFANVRYPFATERPKAVHVAVHMENLGVGPALVRRIEVRHPMLSLMPYESPFPVKEGKPASSSWYALEPFEWYGSGSWTSAGELTIHYLDLLGQHWTTRVPIKVDCVKDGDGAYRLGEPNPVDSEQHVQVEKWPIPQNGGQ